MSGLQLKDPAVALERPSPLNHMDTNMRWRRSLLNRAVEAAAVSHVIPPRPPSVSRSAAPLLR